MSFNVDVSSSAPAVDGGRGPYLLGETMSVDRTFNNPDTHTLAALDHTVALGPGDERTCISWNQTLLMQTEHCLAIPKNDGSAVGVVHTSVQLCANWRLQKCNILTPISRRRDVVALLKPAVADGRLQWQRLVAYLLCSA